MREIYSQSFEAHNTDAEVGGLLSRAQRGDTSAVEQLVERHRDDVYGFLLQMTRSPTVAAELTGQSFLSTHLRLKQFRSEAGYAASLHCVAAECALRKSQAGTNNQVREQRLKLPDLDECIDRATYSPIDWTQGATDRALSAELRRTIELAVDQLPPP